MSLAGADTLPFKDFSLLVGGQVFLFLIVKFVLRKKRTYTWEARPVPKRTDRVCTGKTGGWRERMRNSFRVRAHTPPLRAPKAASSRRRASLNV